MSRWVETSSGTLVSREGGGSEDGYTARLAKYVPAEVLTVFTAAYGVLSALQTTDGIRQGAAVALIAVFTVATLIYVRRAPPTEGQKQAHSVVSSIAFLALAYPIASTALGDWYVPIIVFAAQVVVLALSFFVRPPAID